MNNYLLAKMTSLNKILGRTLIYIYVFVSMGSPFGPAKAPPPRKRATRKCKAGQVKGQRSHDDSEMGKKVSDLVLCFSSSFAYSEAAEAAKVWAIYRRRIVPSNGRLM